MKPPTHSEIAIIGGGITGLATAYFLRRQGRDPIVLEKSLRLGGAIGTERVEGFLIEQGPNSILETTPVLQELIQGLGLPDQVVYAGERAKKRYIVRGGKLRPLPMSPPAFIASRLFSVHAKLRLLKEPFIPPAPPDADESLADFVRRRLGEEFLDYAINPFVAGVYAGRPEYLSVRSAFPKLHQLEQRYGSLIRGAILGAKERRRRAETEKTRARLLSFREGLGTLIDALAAHLGSAVTTGAEVQAVEAGESGYRIRYVVGGEQRQLTCAALVVTIPAHAYEKFPLPGKKRLAEALSRIDHPPVAVVFFGYRRAPESVPLDGFGMLLPEKENRRILGTLWNSTIFPQRAPAGGVALTTFVGGTRQPEYALLPEDRLIQMVQEELQDLMKIHAPPDVVRVVQWEKAIPQYEIGHQRILAEVEAHEAEHPGLYIAGNFRGGISVADCIRNAKELSQKVEKFLQPSRVSNATVLTYPRDA
ncbi:MAG: protoporphyrinogen oxidase [Calditrichaeota bacterium]|nr:MAG: protoporphyrinogen oxidase [Calditrichota bacterium]